MDPNEGMRGDGLKCVPRAVALSTRLCRRPRRPRAGRFALVATLIAAAAFGVVWSVPRVSATASSWLAAPATTARLVAVPVSGGGGGASGALELRPARAASPLVIDAGLRFNMLAVLLKSSRPYDPDLDLRVRTSADGVTWGEWVRLKFVKSEGTPGSAFDRNDTSSEPLWVGEARYVQYTLGLASGATPVDVSDVRFSFINTLGDADVGDALVSTLKRGLAVVAGVGRVAPALSLADRPPIVTRSQWGADESLRSGSPNYASLRMVFIHHTAGSNSYSRSEAPAVVRGIYYYHTRVRGWSDIGYNFLVDRYGTIYEGRYGGMTRGVVGAQVLGFNTHSAGISVMGTFDRTPPPGAAVYALERLIAWRLDVAHVDPLGQARMRCATSDRYAAGQTVTFPVIAGHREANYTSCPGNALYAILPEIRAAVAQRGQPKIYAPSSSVTAISPDGDGVNDSATLSAVLSETADWTIDVKDATGVVVRHFSGRGRAIEALWGGRDEDGVRVTDGVYDAVMVGSNDHGVTRSAMVRVRVDTIPPTVSGVGATRAVSPNGDRIGDSTAIAYAVSEAGRVRARIYDKDGLLARTVLAGSWVSRGPHSVKWDGRVTSPSGLVPARSGTYTVRIREADAAGNAGVGSGSAKVNLTLGFPKAKPRYFSPNGDGVRDTSLLSFGLSRAASVDVVVRNTSGVVRIFSLGTLQPGAAGPTWNGETEGGKAPGGGYTFIVKATNSLGTIAVSGPVVIDRYVPQPSVPADFAVALGTRITYAYTVKDPFADEVYVRVEVRNGKGVLLADLVPGWVTTGVRHKISYLPKVRRLYVFTLSARDRAGNVAAPVTTTVRVR